jgi:hypothetical protein
MAKCTRIAALALSAALLAGPAWAQGFEGVVAYRMTSESGKSSEMEMAIKGTVVRVDMNSEGHQAASLMDGQTGTMTMILPEQKMYMTMNVRAMAEKMKGMKDDDAPPTITALGTSETIAGRKCENFLVETQNRKKEVEKTEVCNAKGLGEFMIPRGPMGREASPGMARLDAYREYFKGNLFPLRVTKVDGAKRLVIMEATRIEPKALDPALFQVPPGFTEMKMPGMMGPPRQ